MTMSWIIDLFEDDDDDFCKGRQHRRDDEEGAEGECGEHVFS